MPLDFNTEPTEIAFSTRYQDLPAAVVALYAGRTKGTGPCALALQDLLSDKAAALGRTLGKAMPHTADSLVNHLSDSFFWDVRPHDAVDNPFQLFFVIPIGSVAVTLEFYSAITLRSPDYEEKWLRLIPPAFRPLTFFAWDVSINLTSPAYIGLGEVQISSFPARTTAITEFVKGRARQPLKKRFEDLNYVRVFSQHGNEAWFICFDEKAQDPALWLVCDGGRTVARLKDPAAAYDAMGVHYLSGKKEPFDFRPFAE